MKIFEVKTELPFKFNLPNEWRLLKEETSIAENKEEKSSLTRLVCISQEKIAGEILIDTFGKEQGTSPSRLVNSFISDLEQRKMRVSGSVLLPVDANKEYVSSWFFNSRAEIA
jgi:hypothetical protein